MPLTETLNDTFTGTTIDTSKWSYIGGAVSQNDRLILPVASNYSSILESYTNYQFNDSYIMWENVYFPSNGNGTKEFYVEYGDNSGDNAIWTIHSAGALFLSTRTGGADPVYGSGGAVNTATARYARMRDGGSNIILDISADGTNWTQHDSITKPAWVNSLTNGSVVFFTGYWGTESSDLTYEIDNLNEEPEPWGGPTLANFNTTVGTNHGASRAMNMPADIAAGDLMLAFMSYDNPGSASEILGLSTGWTQLVEFPINSAVHKLLIAARIADGSANDTLTVSVSGGNNNQDFCCLTLRVTNHGVSNVTTDIGIPTTAQGSSGNANPPNLNMGTAKDYLWLAVAAVDATTTGTTISADPANYTNVATLVSTGGVSAGSTSSSLLRVARRYLNASVENPGTFTNTSPRNWGAQTLAIPPAEPAEQEIEASHLSDAATVYSPTVSPGAVTVAANHLSDTATVYSPAVTPGSVTVVANLVTDPASVFQPSVSVGAVTVEAPVVSAAAMVHSPALSYTIAADALSVPAMVHSPAVAPGAVEIVAELVAVPESVYEPSVSVGAVPFYEPWTGDDDDPWPVEDWYPHLPELEPYFTIQGNKGRALATANNYEPAKVVCLRDLTGDVDIYVEAYIAHDDCQLRITFGSQTTADFNGHSLLESYHFRVDPRPWGSFERHLFKITDEGGEVQLDSYNPDGFVVDVTYGIRIQHIASEGLMRARIWPLADGEPSTWDVEAEDSDYAGGTLAISIQNGGGTVSEYIDFDELYVDYYSDVTPTVVVGVVNAPATVYAPKVVYLVEPPTVAAATTVHEPVVTAGEVTVVAGLVQAAAVVNNPTVTVGEVIVVANLVTASVAVYSPSVAVGEAVVVADIVSTSTTVNAPSVTYIVDVPTVAGTSTVYNPTVIVGEVIVVVPVVDAAAVVQEPAINTGEIVTVVPVVSTTATVYEPTINVGEVTVVVNVVAASATVNAPSVIYSVSAQSVVASATVHEPTIDVGEVEVVVPVVTAATTVYNPVVSAGGIVIVAPLVQAPVTVLAPDLYYIVNVAAVVASAAVLTPSIGVVVAVDELEAPATVFEPGVTAGEVTVVVPAIETTASVLPPQVSAGATVIVAPVFNAEATVHEPTITTGESLVVAPAVLASATVYEPTITVGEVTVVANLVEVPAGVLQPSVVQVVAVPAVSVTATVYEPTISVGAVTVVVPVLDAPVTVLDPAAGLLVKAPLIENAATVLDPTVDVGAVTITVDTVTTPATVNAPQVVQHVVVAGLAAPAQVWSPSVAAQVVPPTINDPANVHTPSIFTGSVDIVVLTVNEPSTVYTPKVAYAVTVATIHSGTVVHEPFIDTITWITTELLANPTVVLRPSVGASGRFAVVQTITVAELVQNIQVRDVTQVSVTADKTQVVATVDQVVQSSDVDDMTQTVEVIG